MSDRNFALMAGVNTVAATPADQSNKNIPVNLARGFPRLHQMPEFQRVKGPNAPIALVGGGPSLKETIGELKDFRHVFACGSSHDYLVKSGIIPEYCAACDPDPVMASYLKTPSTETKYLISSHCDDAVFKALEGMSIALWHCAPIDKDFLDEVDPGWHIVGGGCTVGLRALSIAIVLGYENIHFFGFDTCLGEKDAHHAYEFETAEEEVGKTYDVKVGYCGEGPAEDAKVFRCAGYHLGQAAHFKEFISMYGGMFTPTFHGGGLLRAIWEMTKTKSEKFEELRRIALESGGPPV